MRPTPLIERTAPGQPGSAFHLNRSITHEEADMSYRSSIAARNAISEDSPMDLAHAADMAFRDYDFGQRVSVEEDVDKDEREGVLHPDMASPFEHESREWQYTNLGNELARPVYVLTDGGGDVPYWVRLLFTVRFYPSSAHVMDVYALDGKGSIWGRASQTVGSASWDESLVKGPWRWRWISDDENNTVAMILETTARPKQDPVIMQALVGKRILTVGARAAALELMRLAPEMLQLLAEIVKASKESPERLATHAAEAEALLESLTLNHHSVDFRVPGYWSAEE